MQAAFLVIESCFHPPTTYIHRKSGNNPSLLVTITLCTTLCTACFSSTSGCLVILTNSVHISPSVAAAFLLYLMSEFKQHRYFVTSLVPRSYEINNILHVSTTQNPSPSPLWLDQGEPLLASSSVSADANDLLTLGKPTIHSSSSSSSSPSGFVSTRKLVLAARLDLTGVSVAKAFPSPKSNGDEDFWLEALLPISPALVTVLRGTNGGGLPVNCLMGLTGVSSTKT